MTTKMSQNSDDSQAFCLRWTNFQLNMLNVFNRLFKDEQFVDVTIACEGKLIKAHKMVLSASSSYFQEIFANNPCPHPVVFMKDVSLKDLKQVIEFMYKGEINVTRDSINSFLIVAKAFQVRGLAHVSEVTKDMFEMTPTSTPTPMTLMTPATATTSNDTPATKTSTTKRFRRRTRAQHSVNPLESLDLIEDITRIESSQPINGDTETMHTPKRSRIIEDEHPVIVDAIDLSSNPMENNDNFSALVIDSVRSIKNEQDDDLLCELAAMDDANIQGGFHWMDPSVTAAMSMTSDLNEDYDDQTETPKKTERTESQNQSGKMKSPSWTVDQLREAIQSVITQKMRFTQASIKFNIPKGTLYDNILGKSNRMDVLTRSGLNANDEATVLEFCCDLSTSPYNRRTRKPLTEIIQFVYKLNNCNHRAFDQSGKFAYRWWWAFCKKYSVVSLYYDVNTRR